MRDSENDSIESPDSEPRVTPESVLQTVAASHAAEFSNSMNRIAERLASEMTVDASDFGEMSATSAMMDEFESSLSESVAVSAADLADTSIGFENELERFADAIRTDLSADLAKLESATTVDASSYSDPSSLHVRPPTIPYPSPQTADRDEGTTTIESREDLHELLREHGLTVECDGCGKRVLRENSHGFVTTDDGETLCGGCRSTGRSIQ